MSTVNTEYKIFTPTIKQGKRGFPGPGGVSGGVFIHNELTGLDYVNAGHTGFLSSTATAADSDKLDGQHGSYYAPIASPVLTGTGSWDSPTLYIDSSNHRVGIGTTTPSNKLHIKGGYALFNNNNGNDDTNSGIRICSDISTSTHNWLLGAQHNIDNGFEITPSTAVGGTTFTTPILIVDLNGIKSELLQSITSFSTGFAGDGFKIAETGGVSSLEVDSLTVRGTLKAYELQINKIHSINGGIVVSYANAKATTVSGTTIYFDEGIGLTIPFVIDDYIRAQQFTGTGVASYLGKVTAVNTGNIVATTIAGTPYNGMELVQLGNSNTGTYPERQSAIYITAAETNNPYIAGYSGITDGLFAGHVKFMLGNLETIASVGIVPASPGYGLYCDNVYLSGKIVASSGAVGAWDIDSDSIYTGTKYTGSTYTVNEGDITINSNGSIHAKYFYLNNTGHINFAATEINHLVTKKASNNRRNFHDASISETFTYTPINYVKMKSIIFTNGIKGVVRVDFDMATDDLFLATAYMILRHSNGDYLGTQQTQTGTSLVSKVQDITDEWLPGESIEIWGGVTAGYTAYNANFGLSYDDDPTVAVIVTASTP